MKILSIISAELFYIQFLMIFSFLLKISIRKHLCMELRNLILKRFINIFLIGENVGNI